MNIHFGQAYEPSCCWLAIVGRPAACVAGRLSCGQWASSLRSKSGRLSALPRRCFCQLQRRLQVTALPGAASTRRLVRIYDMAVRMKTTLNIDDAVMAELKREAARQRPHDVRTRRDRVAPIARPSTKAGGDSPPCQSSAAAGHLSMLPIAMPCTTPWKVASFIRPGETGSSANGRDRVLGTPPGQFSMSFCA
jgi:hypothetical protein